MICRLIILLLVAGLFAQNNDASIVRFDPETGEIIEPDLLGIHFGIGGQYLLLFHM